MRKAVSLALFAAMWVVPPGLHALGWNARVGHPIEIGWGMTPLYTGTASHAGLSFIILYTAWVRYMSMICSARHTLRLQTASVWIPAVITGLLYSPLTVQVFFSYISVLGVFEFRDVLSPVYTALTKGLPGGEVSRWPVGVAAATISLSTLSGNWDLFGFATLLAVSGMCVVYPIAFPLAPREVLNLDLFGLAWVAWTLSFAGMTLHLPSGKGWIFLGLSCGWIGNGGAYFIGSKWGRHKCIPKVSPGKSWEGIAAELVFTLVAAGLVQGCYYYGGAQALDQPAFTPGSIFLLAVLLTFNGVMGDLCESMLKRIGEKKDSGDFFPGHGGILDRFDGFFFAAITVAVCASVVQLNS